MAGEQAFRRRKPRLEAQRRELENIRWPKYSDRNSEMEKAA
jgi:hypothetical protein